MTTGCVPRLSIARILQMNLGFFGLQFSFGLQQANMGPIYSYLGASEASLPLLQLAGPVTGLLVQPLVGALSDRTASRWGRRTPYFVVGAIMCSLALFLMPLSTSLMMAVSLLWILDAGNNVTMEPYRAYVKDRLIADQQPIGFLSQSAFTGLAQTLAFLTPTLLVHGLGMDKDAVGAHNIPDITRATFIIGAILSLGTMAWSLLRVRERILPERERAQLARLPRSPAAIISEILSAFRAMPDAMRRMMLMSLFQWYAMTCFWAYSAYAIGRSLHGTTAPTSTGFRDAVLMNGQVGAFYNFIAFAAGLALVPLARRRDPMMLHALCLALSAIGMLSFARADTDGMLFLIRDRDRLRLGEHDGHALRPARPCDP